MDNTLLPFELQFHKKQIFLDDYQGKHELKPNKSLSALITPHAALKYCGNLLDNSYSQIDWKKYEKIIMLSTHHKKGNFIPQSKKFFLPNKTFNILDLNIDDIVEKSDEMFLNEHSWLVQMPFIRFYNIPICIILIGDYDKNLVNRLSQIIDYQTLLLANTDLLHCGKRFNVNCPQNYDKFNMETIQKIKNLETEGYKNHSMCGYNCIRTFIEILRNNYKIEYVKDIYFSSSDIDKKLDTSVGYASLSFFDSNVLRKKEISILKIPSKIIDFYFSNKEYKLKIENQNDINDVIFKFNSEYRWNFINKEYGIFVTINDKNNKLRGCIGTFKPSEVGNSIAKQTLLSAFFDNRFSPVTKLEFPNLKYKINFLGTPFIVYKFKEYTSSPLNTLLVLNPPMKFGESIGHGITVKFNNGTKSTYLSSVLKNFEVNDLDSLEDRWEYLISSMYIKAGNKITGSMNKLIDKGDNFEATEEIQQISLFLCKEFNESEELNLLGGSYLYKVNYSN